MFEPPIHCVVDEGVDRGIGHGKPIEGQVDMFDEGTLDDGVVMEYIEKIDIVWQPADTKGQEDEHKHLDNLLLVLLSPGQGI